MLIVGKHFDHKENYFDLRETLCDLRVSEFNHGKTTHIDRGEILLCGLNGDSYRDIFTSSVKGGHGALNKP